MFPRTTSNRAFSLLLFVALVSGIACRESDHEVPPFRRTESLSFEKAIEEKHVKRKASHLGSIARTALHPAHRPALAPDTSFSSDPFEVAAESELIVSMGMLSYGLDIDPKDRPTFRVDIIGPEGEENLFETTGQEDFGLDEWNVERVAIPTRVGSPVTIRFYVTPSSNPKRASASATPLWGVPRLIRTSQSARPNVLFVVLDTLRADHTQPYGYDRKTTPFLSELASRGAVAEEVVATYPTTLSSHWSIFTGLFPARHGVYPGTSKHNPPAQPLLAQIFQDGGYRTSAFTEGGFVHSIFGFASGFDLYHNSTKSEVDDLSSSAKKTFSLAMDWLIEARDEPFFLFLHTYQVHMPYEPADAYRRQFAGDYQGAWAKEFPAIASYPINNRIMEPTDTEIAHIKNLYDAEIRELDDLFAQFWSQLEAMGILDDTIVVITSDHGEDLVEHGWLNHGTTLYDDALLVPLIVLAPDGVTPGTRITCQRSSTDLMPTVLELAGLPVPEGLDGQSMTREFMGGPCVTDRAAFSELTVSTFDSQVDLPIVSLRKSGWKLIRHLQSNDLEAYDLRNDPNEQHGSVTEPPAELVRELDDYIDRRPDHLDAHVTEGEDAIPDELRDSLRALGYTE